MINVQDYLIRVMKKQLFSASDDQNKAARQILAQLKTKFVDIKEEITPEIQYKLLKKMYDERIATADTYRGANRIDLANKEMNQANVAKSLMSELQKDLPKALTEDQITDLIKINKFANIGQCMKWFKQNYPTQDKKQISMLFNKNK